MADGRVVPMPTCLGEAPRRQEVCPERSGQTRRKEAKGRVQTEKDAVALISGLAAIGMAYVANHARLFSEIAVSERVASSVRRQKEDPSRLKVESRNGMVGLTAVASEGVVTFAMA